MKHPVHDLLNKTNPTPDERVAIYALMLLSTDEKYEKLGVEELYDKLLLEYEETKQLMAMEGVPEDKPGEISANELNSMPKNDKIANLIMLTPASKHKN